MLMFCGQCFGLFHLGNTSCVSAVHRRYFMTLVTGGSKKQIIRSATIYPKERLICTGEHSLIDGLIMECT